MRLFYTTKNLGFIEFLQILFILLFTVGLQQFCWTIWLARNQATFERKWINTAFEIVFTACAFLIYWAGLQKPDMMGVIKHGAELLKENASQMLLLCGPLWPGLVIEMISKTGMQLAEKTWLFHFDALFWCC